MTSDSPFRKVQPVRAYETIVAQFDEAIRSGAIKPGDRLPSERELMGQFGVGRSTVREALRVLQSNGMVRSRPGDPRGPEVVAFSAERLVRPIEALLAVGQVNLYELVFFRMITEGNLTGLAATAPRDRPEAVRELRAVLDAMKEGARHGMTRFLAADSMFHEAIGKLADHSFLAVQDQVVRTAVRSYLASNMDTPVRQADYMSRAIESHEVLVGHIEDGNQQAAMRMSYRTVLAHYSAFFGADEVERLRHYFLGDEPGHAPTTSR